MKPSRISLAVAVLMLAATLVVFAQVSTSSQPATCPISPNNNMPTCQMTPLSRVDRTNSIGSLLQANNRVSIFVEGLQNTGMLTTMQDQGPFTLFIPTNDAFMRIPEGTRSALFMSDNWGRLRDVVLTHVVQGQNIRMQDLRLQSNIITANCQTLSVRSVSGGPGVAGGDLYVGNARIVGSPINASNGTIYMIDTVLIPGCSDVNMMNTLYINGISR